MRNSPRWLFDLLLVGTACLTAGLLLASEGSGLAARPGRTSCIVCHGDRARAGEASQEIVKLESRGAHQEADLSCHDCHGGNPDLAVASNQSAAMDPHYTKNPFRGAPKRNAIPAFCARCHSSASYMKRFRPDARVDQFQEYQTSRHGELLKQGDTKVATCVDCHGTHGILRPTDTDAPVFPTHVADTCARCHENARTMSGYKLPDGRPIPTDQRARWRRSVHAQALLEREDLSAPTCNDCHGNHGAAPPGLESVSFVCGQCHTREASLFRESAKAAGFRRHRKHLAEAGQQGCPACHPPPHPAASFRQAYALTECEACHGNHAVVRPSIAMVAPLPETPCAFCHEGRGPLAETVPEPAKRRRRFERKKSELLAEASSRGLKGTVLFDWLVDRALELPTHSAGAPSRRPSAGEELGRGPELRAEFKQLFTKFRIGKTYFLYDGPTARAQKRAEVIRCSGCHSPEITTVDGPGGLVTSRELMESTREVTSLLARAERLVLSARRGGVQVRRATTAIEKAISAQTELQVLVHSFSAGKGSPFIKKRDEALQHIETALTIGQKALKEINTRRKGLIVSLVLIMMLLTALGLKIRQMARAERTRSE